MKYSESINDKSILKVIFLAGGPGSGKSYIASEMFSFAKDNISFLGPKVLNTDIPLEFFLDKNNISKNIDPNNVDLYDLQMKARAWAKKIVGKEKRNYINSMLPLVIDGTGKNYEKIVAQASLFTTLGYDTYMVFVNTSLDVALQRNNERPRKLDSKLVEKMWIEVQKNLGKFQKFFGAKNFIIVDNNEDFRKDPKKAEAFSRELFIMGAHILNTPLKNPVGRNIISELKSSGGKYLDDLPNKPILNESTKQFLGKSKIKEWASYKIKS